MMEFNSNSRIFIASNQGLVGASLLRKFQQAGFSNFILCTRLDVDLASRKAVFQLFQEAALEYVIMTAAKEGGIAANLAAPVDFPL